VILEAITKNRLGMVIRGILLMVLLSTSYTAIAQTEQKPQESNGTRVLEAFDRQQVQRVNNAGAISDHEKQVIIFAMGAPLAVLLLITGGLGIATGIYGKQLFVAHMIFAGLTITLALAHAIVGLVWFFPF
jgi:hypothetical protein